MLLRDYYSASWTNGGYHHTETTGSLKKVEFTSVSGRCIHCKWTNAQKLTQKKWKKKNEKKLQILIFHLKYIPLGPVIFIFFARTLALTLTNDNNGVVKLCWSTEPQRNNTFSIKPFGHPSLNIISTSPRTQWQARSKRYLLYISCKNNCLKPRESFCCH